MSVAALLDTARVRLRDAPREGLGELIEPKRILGIRRAPKIVPRGSAWHLGVLLITDEGVAGVGDIIRARAEVRRGFTAESQRQRALIADAARRGGFGEGETVHVGWRMLDLDRVERGDADGPLALVDGVPSVRWSARGGFAPLASYLDERVALLVEPPAGADGVSTP